MSCLSKPLGCRLYQLLRIDTIDLIVIIYLANAYTRTSIHSSKIL